MKEGKNNIEHRELELAKSKIVNPSIRNPKGYEPIYVDYHILREMVKTGRKRRDR